MDTAPTALQITEIYASIQGESTRAGLPCVFVRFTGCNLRCSYCDTEYAFYGGQRMTLDQILDTVIGFDIPLVEITGGEPLLQPGCPILCERLLQKGKMVLIETSGERPIDVLPEGVIRIMDLKCPSSGESERNNWDNIRRLNMNDEVKFVIGDRRDYEWSRNVISEHDLGARCTVLLSPVFDKLDPSLLVTWLMEDKLPARMQLQMHKYVWDPETQSV